MKTRNKLALLLSIGVLNLVHGGIHIIQLLQSVLLVSYSVEEDHHHHESWIEELLHNPYLSFIWAVVGILTIWIGIKDYRHHRGEKKRKFKRRKKKY
jgi:hypothetical protein